MVGASAPQPRYRKDIDGLRALAVLAVLLFHARVPAVSGGFVGVDVFFVISGYLITTLIATERAEARFSMARFYARRIRRILPALVLVLAATTVAAIPVLTPGVLRDYAVTVIAAALMVANVHYFSEAGYFAGPADRIPLLHTWSLSAEEQFYLIWPLLLTTLAAKRNERAMCIVVFCVSLLASAWAARFAPEAGFYLLPTRAWELLLGAMAALGMFPVPRSAMVANAISIAGLAAILAAAGTFSRATPFPGVAALVPTVGALLILLSGVGQRAVVNRLLGTRPIVFVGLISYSLYLWHWPMLVLTGAQLNRDLTGTEAAGVLVLSFFVSCLSWRYVEQPFRRPTPSATTNRKALIMGPIALGACVVAGVAVIALPPWNRNAAARIATIENARWSYNPLEWTCRKAGGGLPPAEGCMFGPRPLRDTPSVVVWGDSHASALVPGIASLADEAGFSGRQITQNACPPLLGVAFDFNRNCAAFNEATVKVLETSPSIHAVVLSARWGLYAETTRRDVNKSFRLVDAADGSPQVSSPQVLARGLERTVATLHQRGIGVLLVADVPEFAFNPALCIAKELGSNRSEDACSLPTESAREQLAWTEPIFQDIASRYPALRIVWPLDAFCDVHRCSAMRNGTVLYRNENHLNQEGARYLALAIKQPLQNLLH